MVKQLLRSIAFGVLAVGLNGCDKQSCGGAGESGPAASDQGSSATAPAGSTVTPAPTPAADHPYATQADYESPAVQTTDLPSGLKIEDLKIGSGAICLPKAVATFHYRAKPVGGAEFIASAENDEAERAPEVQPLGRMMPGMSEGLVGMRVGGRRRLTIPSEMAFGFIGAKNPQGEFVVPPDTDVVFIVDLLELKQSLAVPAPAGGAQ
ncbi:MAG: FKBP-type peptidyl-prolyl cis-trans isomerase [Phycisphaerales bacterium]